jgi:hypothetical protein
MIRVKGLSLGLLITLPLLLSGQSTALGATDAQRVLRVGAQQELKQPSAAAKVAQDGDTVVIEAGEYVGDVAVWPQSRLTLRGVNGRVHLKAGGKAAERKAIWVIRGDDVVVEGIEFSGARVPHRNGAGIRAEGAGLTIRDSYFHDNEMGILTSNNARSVLTIVDSEFKHNTVDFARHGRLGHNIYVGRIARFVLERSTIHGAETGHQVKSRARRSEIVGNSIRDQDGGSSYLIDISDGGEAIIRDNDLQQSERAPNRTAIAFAPEAKGRSAPGFLVVSDNRFVSEGSPGTFVTNHSTVEALLRGNRLTGRVTALRGPGKVTD